jgi:hypothetical protein
MEDDCIESEPGKIKTTLSLSLATLQKLEIHCAMERIDRSAMLSRLINDHLRRYEVTDLGEFSGVLTESD